MRVAMRVAMRSMQSVLVEYCTASMSIRLVNEEILSDRSVSQTQTSTLSEILPSQSIATVPYTCSPALGAFALDSVCCPV